MNHEDIVNTLWAHLADMSNKSSGWKYHVLQEVLIELSRDKKPEKVVKLLLNNNVINSKGKLENNFKILLSADDSLEFEIKVKELIQLGMINEIRDERLNQKEIDPGIFGIIKRLSNMSFIENMNEKCSGHYEENGKLGIVFKINEKTKIFHNKIIELERSNDYFTAMVRIDDQYYKQPKLFKYLRGRIPLDFEEIIASFSENGKLEITYYINVINKKVVKNEELRKKFWCDALARFWEAFSRVINEFEYGPIQEKLDAEFFEVRNH